MWKLPWTPPLHILQKSVKNFFLSTLKASLSSLHIYHLSNNLILKFERLSKFFILCIYYYTYILYIKNSKFLKHLWFLLFLLFTQPHSSKFIGFKVEKKMICVENSTLGSRKAPSQLKFFVFLGKLDHSTRFQKCGKSPVFNPPSSFFSTMNHSLFILICGYSESSPTGYFQNWQFLKSRAVTKRKVDPDSFGI